MFPKVSTLNTPVAILQTHEIDPLIHSGEAERLLVIVMDRLSAVLKKGEVTPRYYNPGNLFCEVHLLLINDDRPDMAAVQKMVGTARLFMHNLPCPIPWQLAAIHPPVLDRWVQQILPVLAGAPPQLIRCHGMWYNAVAGVFLKKQFRIPLVVSMHCTPDWDRKFGNAAFNRPDIKFSNIINSRLESYVARQFDCGIGVYHSISSFLKKLSSDPSKIITIYNVISDAIIRKKTYQASVPFKLLTVGNQIKREKDQSVIIKALAQVHGAELHIFGEGPEHQALLDLANELNVMDRIFFYSSIANEQLVREMHHYDAYIFNEVAPGISKTIMESCLAGLPTIHNRRDYPLADAEMLNNPGIILVKNTPEAYAAAINKLMEDNTFRETSGQAAFEYAREHWSPAHTELEYVQLYRELMKLR